MFQKISDNSFPEKIELLADTTLWNVILENIGGFLGLLQNPYLLDDIFFTIEIAINSTYTHFRLGGDLRDGHRMNTLGHKKFQTCLYNLYSFQSKIIITPKLTK